MVEIPPQIDPTLKAMCDAIESEQHNEPKRKYLGASQIGNECMRQIYYSYNGFAKQPFSAKTLMNFADGHRTEDLTAERLRKVDGIELVTHKDDGSQYGFSALGGEFKGHYDGAIRGIYQAPKAWHIWEGKCSGEKQWKKFKKAKYDYGDKSALENWSTNYYAQAQIYMHYAGIDRHYLTLAYAGGRDYDSCRTNYKPEIALMYIDRAEKIINATEPPARISNNEDFFICRWCDYSEECHRTN